MSVATTTMSCGVLPGPWFVPSKAQPEEVDRMGEGPSLSLEPLGEPPLSVTGTPPSVAAPAPSVPSSERQWSRSAAQTVLGAASSSAPEHSAVCVTWSNETILSKLSPLSSETATISWLLTNPHA